MEFWLGLDKLRQLSASGAKLRIELETYEVLQMTIILLKGRNKVRNWTIFRVRISMPPILPSEWRGRSSG